MLFYLMLYFFACILIEVCLCFSGVAVLSCTDCSTYSGSSTASSDITDPGSPFSTASSHSEDSASQPPKMPPNLSAHHPPWPWAGGDTPPLKRTSPSTKTASPKRLKTETDVKHSTNETLPGIEHKKRNETKATTVKRKKDIMGACKVQQGKITEYFKSQMKASVKKETSSLTKTVEKVENKMNMQKYFTLIDGPKVILNGKCGKLPDLYKKFDVRTLTVTAPIKKVVLDTKTRKISQLISVPRKILPAPKPDKKQSPTVKLTTLRLQQDLKCIKNIQPIDNLFVNKIGNIKRTPQNTVIPILQKVTTNLNLKVSSTVVPIVKLNMPSKLNGSNLNNNINLCVDTAVPTVPTIKTKNSQDVLKSPTSPNECKEGSCSSSDSGVSVKDLLSVSVTPTEEVEEQKSPILSQPKTIRFPAKQVSNDPQKDRSDSNDGLCRWSECQSTFDTSGALLEHLQVRRNFILLPLIVV